ncbi:division/cell wall cluster transcriptional repressor MraZ [Mycoplasma sp. SG1]|uniref:division/cell wall cluster transcriptional repressor MraZ n=1 Tax=Mycoplasma sp. SG1 TaxID=2810348 RepID=UPI00202576B0|nr:division/cell wall cluster transcriptional repressor MraZ [Mycoplasma sp. SG1]URM53185.1 division/cell wall cluster transcriptional repressor MraZ [Mycoplasma sp. SG1]
MSINLKESDHKIYLTGTYYGVLDERNRFNLPKKIYESLTHIYGPREINLFLKVRATSDKCIDIFPEIKYKELSEQISDLPENVQNNRIYKRSFFGSIEKATLDKRHRLLLSDNFFKSLELDVEKDLVFVGMGSYIQLFKKSKFLELQKQEISNAESIEEKINL